MREQIARLDGIEVAYETFGEPGRPLMVLVMGIGVQMLGWDEEFCEMLAGRGFRVVRFDNRDVGRSSKIEGGPRPDLAAAALGDTSSASYTLAAMAGDVAGLIERLGAEAAHVVGVSMGGMIAQEVAVHYPERVLSLTSMMASTGERTVGQPRPEALAVLFTPQPQGREVFVEHAVRIWRVLRSPGFPPDEERIRQRAAASYDRCFYPEGFARQLLAVLASGNRTESLPTIRAPTLVIHGRDDPLIDVSGGEATARAIPNAELLIIPGLGHDLPRAVWPQLVDAITDHAARATAGVVGEQ